MARRDDPSALPYRRNEPRKLLRKRRMLISSGDAVLGADCPLLAPATTVGANPREKSGGGRRAPNANTSPVDERAAGESSNADAPNNRPLVLERASKKRLAKFGLNEDCEVEVVVVVVAVVVAVVAVVVVAVVWMVVATGGTFET